MSFASFVVEDPGLVGFGGVQGDLGGLSRDLWQRGEERGALNVQYPMINIQCSRECPGIGCRPGLYPRRDRERTARHPCKGGLQWGEEISISNVQGKMKSLGCADVVAIVCVPRVVAGDKAASCRRTPNRAGGAEYPMFNIQ